MKKNKVISSILLTMFLVFGSNNLFAGGLIAADAVVMASSQITVYPDLSDGLRILFVTDTHMYGYTGQGFTNEQRLKFMADSIKAENAKKPIDLCLFLGDLSENNLVLPGKDGVQYIKNNIYPLLKTASGKQIPTYFLSGNHDCYSDSKWQSTFGYYKNFTISCGNFAFICLDAFADSVNRTSNGSFGYTKVDKAWFQQQVAKYSNKKIIVISHYINSTDTDLMNLIANTPNIICSFEGHNHLYSKFTRGNKACYDCGNFSYPVNGFSLNNSWGFRNLAFNSGILKTKVIEPARQYTSYYQPYYETTSQIIYSQ